MLGTIPRRTTAQKANSITKHQLSLSCRGWCGIEEDRTIMWTKCGQTSTLEMRKGIWAARSKTILQSLGITHILNAADGPYNINTGARYYRDLPIEYYGVQAFDDNAFNISIFFHDAANFIRKALNSEGGKVFVHCAMGLSRSATLVLAYLMIHENLTLVEALKSVDSHRGICPNTGFLSQLRDLDIKLNNERKTI
ncbi:dual specificity phosphatase 29-like isoform X1 [Pogona vitticeps]